MFFLRFLVLIREVIIIIVRDNMIVWLMFVWIEGLVNGRFIFVSRYYLLVLKVIVVLCIFFGIFCKLRMVRCMMGVFLKIMVVMMVVGLLVLKKVIIGIMNMKVGIVCMKFMMGWMIE